MFVIYMRVGVFVNSVLCVWFDLLIGLFVVVIVMVVLLFVFVCVFG